MLVLYFQTYIINYLLEHLHIRRNALYIYLHFTHFQDQVSDITFIFLELSTSPVEQ